MDILIEVKKRNALFKPVFYLCLIFTILLYSYSAQANCLSEIHYSYVTPQDYNPDNQYRWAHNEQTWLDFYVIFKEPASCQGELYFQIVPDSSGVQGGWANAAQPGLDLKPLVKAKYYRNWGAFTQTIEAGGDESSLMVEQGWKGIRLRVWGQPDGIDEVLEEYAVDFWTQSNKSDVYRREATILDPPETTINHPPQALDDAITLIEDSARLRMTPLDNDSDPDGDELRIIDPIAEHGTVRLVGHSAIDYTPNTDFYGIDLIRYRAFDGELSDPAVITVTVTPVNDAPLAMDDHFTQGPNSVVATINVLANDLDIENDSLSVTNAVSEAGAVVVNEDQSLTFTPQEGFSGETQITYSLNDSHGGTGSAVVHLTVVPANPTPVAQDTEISISQTSKVSLLNLNQWVQDDHPINWSTLSVSPLNTGKVATLADLPGVLQIDYQGLTWSGIESFTYQVSDVEGGHSNRATVTLQVDVEHHEAPVAADIDLNVTQQQRQVQVDLADYVEANLSIDWNSLQLSQVDEGLVSRSSPSSSMLTLQYANSHYIGTETIYYSVQDMQGTVSNQANIHVSISVVDNPPLEVSVISQSVSHESRVITLDLAPWVTDDNGVDWSSLIISQPHYGQATVVSGSSQLQLDFSQADFDGTDSFTFQVKDSLGAISDLATVILNVNALKNKRPQAGNITVYADNNSLLHTLDLTQYIEDDYGVDWGSFSIEQPQPNGFSINLAETQLTLDFTGFHHQGRLNIDYHISDIDGERSNTGEFTFILDLVAIPSSPSEVSLVTNNLSAGPLGQGTLSWVHPDTDLRYKVSHSYNQQEWQALTELLSSKVSVHRHLLNGIHKFSVTACTADLRYCSDPVVSNSISVNKKPDQVRQISAPVLNNQGRLSFSWPKVPNATTYQVEQKAASEEHWTQVGELSPANTVNIAVPGHDSYRYRVKACNELGCGEHGYSDSAEFNLIPLSPQIVKYYIMDGSTDNQTPMRKLEWSKVDEVTGYTVEEFDINIDSWQMVETQFQSTQIVREMRSPKVRVSACNQYGCSTPIEAESEYMQAVFGAAPVSINAFYCEHPVIEQVGQSTYLAWDTQRLTNIKIENMSSGEVFSNLAAEGQLQIQLEETTEFQLTAHNQGEAPVQQRVMVAVKNQPGSAWDEGFGEGGAAGIASSILIDEQGFKYFGDIAGRLHKVGFENQELWEPIDTGIISSAPVIRSNYLYFTASQINGQGQFCRINKAQPNPTSQHLECIVLAHAVVSAPVFDANGDFALVVDLKGGVHKITLADNQIQSFNPLPEHVNVRSTPILTSENTLIVRCTDETLHLLKVSNSAVTPVWVNEMTTDNLAHKE